MRTADDVIREVAEKGGIWEAYDQGRLAFHRGIHINPFENPVVSVCASDWRRGYDYEASLAGVWCR